MLGAFAGFGHRLAIAAAIFVVLGSAFRPSLAFASTATTTASGIQYTAAPGETNELTVSFVSTISVRIVDLGATIQASGGCSSESATSVVCAGSSGLIDLGDLNDTASITAGGTTFTLNGGDGSDSLNLGAAGGTVNGGAGDDALTGSSGGGSIFSNRSDGGPGDDHLQSGSAPQTMIGGPGADTFVGGSGQDCVDYSARTEPVFVTIDDGNANDGAAAENDEVGSQIDCVFGGSGDDTLVGSDAPFEQLLGNSGDDTLDGGGGAEDIVSGGDGNDVLNGGFGADSIRGGPGEDTADYSDRSNAVSVSLGVFGASGNDDDGPAGARDTIDSDVEDIVGGDGNDTLTGSWTDNAIDGGPGSDKIVGGAGEDGADYSRRSEDVSVTLDGTPNSGSSLDGPMGARDTIAQDVEDIYAGSGNDTLIGNAADNFLNGGFGADHLVGGAGEDIASYFFRTNPVTVALDDTPNSGNADDGPPGARDRIAQDVEDIFGGAGNDTLTGNASTNFLFGAGGDDTILSRDSGADNDLCGAGVDSVTADALDSVASDCEHVDRTIPKGNQTITFTPLSNKTYGDPDFTVSATASSGLTVAFGAAGNCAVNGVTVHISGAGSCTLTASQLGDANYNAAPSVSQSFAIAKANQTIAFPALANKTYGAADFNVSATASSGLPVSFTASGSCTITGVTVHITGAGACKVTASQAGDANFNAAATVSQSFAIAKAPVVVRCKVPKVVGKKLAAAKLALKRAHCATGKVSRAYSKKIKKGRVSSQSKRAGRVLPKNTKVNLVVSRGPRH